MNEPTKPNATEDERPLHRIAFLLRLWREESDGRAGWRASLEQTGTGKRIGFASLEQLFMYLIDCTESRVDDQENENRD